MRKRTRRTIRPAKAPCLVVLATLPELGITEHISVQALAQGWATTDHFDNLADCRDLIAIATAEKPDAAATATAELALHALLGIKQRHQRTGKLGASGDELQALHLLVQVSHDYWSRQAGSTFSRHYTALHAARRKQNSPEATQ